MKDLLELNLYKKITSPYLVIGLPDVGLVGLIASTYLAEKSGLKDLGYMDSPKLPPVIPLHRGDPKFPIRIMNSSNLTILFSEIAIPSQLMYPLTLKIIELADILNARKIILLGGMAVPNRMELEKPSVYGIGITKEDKELLKSNNVKLLEEGFIAGIYAQLIKELIKKNKPTIALFGECYIAYPDPGAAATVLEVFSRIFNYQLDLKPLFEQAEELRLKLKDLMKKTLATLRQTGKDYEQSLPLLYR